MEGPGPYLRAARDRQNLSVEEVAGETRIRKAFLKAMEEDRFDLLPSPAYTRGFLALYARCLGLDPAEILLRYEALAVPNAAQEESGKGPAGMGETVSDFRPGPVPEERGERGDRSVTGARRVRVTVVLILLCLIAFSGAYLHIRSRGWFLAYDGAGEEPGVPLGWPVPLLVGEGQPDRATSLMTPVESVDGRPESSSSLAVASGSSRIEVAEAAMGRGIETGEGRVKLTGRSDRFECNQQKVYFLTRIRTPNRTRVVHAWIWGEQEFHTLEIEARPPEWSVYSYLTLRPEQAGPWRVEVRDEGRVLASIPFQVVEERK
jgi:hypothetical protein